MSDQLTNLTLQELQDMARDHGIPDYGRLGKDALVFFLIKGDNPPNDDVRREINAWCMTNAPYNMGRRQLSILARNLGVANYHWMGKDAIIRGIKGNEVWYGKLTRLATRVLEVLTMPVVWLVESMDIFRGIFETAKSPRASRLSDHPTPPKGAKIPNVEDPSIYGPIFKALRTTMRKHDGIVPCRKCASMNRLRLEHIEKKIRDRSARQIELESGGTAYILLPDWTQGAVCRKCVAYFCSQCVGEAFRNKSESLDQLDRVLSRYFPKDTPRELVEIDRSSTRTSVLCPRCQDDLLHGVDHITD